MKYFGQGPSSYLGSQGSTTNRVDPVYCVITLGAQASTTFATVSGFPTFYNAIDSQDRYLGPKIPQGTFYTIGLWS